ALGVDAVRRIMEFAVAGLRMGRAVVELEVVVVVVLAAALVAVVVRPSPDQDAVHVDVVQDRQPELVAAGVPAVVEEDVDLLDGAHDGAGNVGVRAAGAEAYDHAASAPS